jgi:hypothetical protein
MLHGECGESEQMLTVARTRAAVRESNIKLVREGGGVESSGSLLHGETVRYAPELRKQRRDERIEAPPIALVPTPEEFGDVPRGRLH